MAYATPKTPEGNAPSREINPLLPRLTVNRQFIGDFLAAEAPCFALGLVEERQRSCGFMALQTAEVIPAHLLNAGFRFGHSLFGSAAFEVIHFVFTFYGFQAYNVLTNPNNPLVQAVLTTMVESGDYFFFLLDSRGGVTVFRSEIGQEDLAGLKAHPPPIQRSRRPRPSTAKRSRVSGRTRSLRASWSLGSAATHYHCLDLASDRLELTPA